MDERWHRSVLPRMATWNHEELPRHNSAVARKVYHNLLHNHIDLKSRKFLEKSERLSKKLFHHFFFWKMMCIKSRTQFIMDFLKASNSIHRWKMSEIQLICSFLKETVTAIIMLYKTKTIVWSPDCSINFFEIVTEVWLGDGSAPYCS